MLSFEHSANLIPHLNEAGNDALWYCAQIKALKDSHKGLWAMMHCGTDCSSSDFFLDRMSVSSALFSMTVGMVVTVLACLRITAS